MAATPASWAMVAIRSGAMAQLAGGLARAGRLEYRDLGTFTIEAYPARKIHNPKTGQTLELPARKLVRFKPGRTLMAKVFRA